MLVIKCELCCNGRFMMEIPADIQLALDKPDDHVILCTNCIAGLREVSS